MSGKIEISRELAEREFSEFWEQHKLDLLERKIGRSDCRSIWLAARKVAAPVVERQEPVLFVAVESIEDLECVGMHATRNANDLQLVPLYRSPPAPVAIVLPTILSSEQGPHYSDNWTSELGYLAGYNACLDKVKELNQ